ncbi:unnamed protein product [marine sediment metagenome]|uniref:TRASH transcription regulator C-terminal prokaryotic domain-containing protein n=1 Tax=marine sediment metagenome TaxID=412755 RepID=X0UZ09_9ZZZZ
MTKDPAYGMEVDEKNAATSEYKRKVYYFCCPACKGVLIKSRSSISGGNRE